MTRRVPDVEVLVPLVLTDGAEHGTRVPADLLDRLPFHRIKKLGGVAVDPRFLDIPQVQVTTFAASREAASDLAEGVRNDLFDAWQNQHRTTAGVIHRVTEVVSPFEPEVTNPDGVFRFEATYRVSTRP